MHLRHFIFSLLLLCLIFTSAYAQKQKDVTGIYQLVLNDYFDSVPWHDSVPIALIDTTQVAVFWGGFPDDINIQYLGFSDLNLYQLGAFHWRFIDSTSKAEVLPGEIFNDKRLSGISHSFFRKAFWPKRHYHKYVLTNEGYDRFRRQSGKRCFGELSRPFYIDDNTLLIYFNCRCSMEEGLDNVYLMVRDHDKWEIRYKLRQWRL
jgi:hypothetical protein